MQLCYYTPSTHLISTLQKKHLKVSRFNECNDIFELANFRIPYNSDLNKRQEARRPLRKWADLMSKELGLICFAENHHSPLMWAHYAERNKGACLVFEYQPETSKGRLIEVTYKERRDEISPTQTCALPNPNEFSNLSSAELQRCFATKQSRWSYEEELRLLVELSSMKAIKTKGIKNYFLDWEGTLKLKTIYVGAEPNICAKALAPHVSDKVTIKQKRAGFGQYQIVEQRNTKLWKGEKTCSNHCRQTDKSDEGCA